MFRYNTTVLSILTCARAPQSWMTLMS